MLVCFELNGPLGWLRLEWVCGFSVGFVFRGLGVMGFLLFCVG